MKTLTKMTLMALVAAGLSISANAGTLSSKAALTSTVTTTPAQSEISGKTLDVASIGTKGNRASGTSEQVKLANTQNCSKTMAVASCDIHCR